MTLQEANMLAMAAAEAGDMELLESALRARGEAIAGLQREAPSHDLAARIEETLTGGEAIAADLFRWKQRLSAERARLARVMEIVGRADSLLSG